MQSKLKIKYVLSVALVWLSFSSFNTSQKTEVDKALNGMTLAIKELKAYKYELRSIERIRGKTIEANLKVKLNEKPYKLFLYKKESGQEVLYVKGKNNNNALVYPNGFPYINLNLDPYGDLLRKDAHHTLFESSFSFFGGVIEQSVKNLGADFYKYVSYKGDIKFDNRMCYNIVLDYTAFKYVNYTVLANETVISIARKLNLSEHMILEKNNLSGYGALKKGLVIKVPNLYAKKIVMYIDKASKLSACTSVYDDVGLYEYYEYNNVNANPQFMSDEFLSSFKEYHF